MRIFFDNCTSPTLASTMHGYLQHYGKMLGDDKTETWIVVTGDTRIQKNPAERLAFRQAHLRGFVLAPAYQKTPINQQAALVLWRWPDIDQLAKLTGAPFLFELPINKSSKIRPLPL